MEAQSKSLDFSSVSDIQSIKTDQEPTLFQIEKDETETDDVFTVEQSNSSVFQQKKKNDVGQDTCPFEDEGIWTNRFDCIENGKCERRSGWNDPTDIVTLGASTGNEVKKRCIDPGFKSGDEGDFYSKHRDGPISMIIVTKSGINEADENGSNNQASLGGFWEQIICGMQADRMIFLLLSALLVAVAFVVGAIAMTGKSDPDSTQSASIASRPDELLPLTSPPDPFDSKVPLTLTAFPTTLPWDKEACGGDSPTAFFTDALDKTLRKCSWLAEDESRRERLCVLGSAAFILCRESCRNCVQESSTSMPTGTSAALNYRINAGGDNFVAENGNVWEADDFFFGGDIFAVSPNIDILSTTDDPLFRISRTRGSSFHYSFPVVADTKFIVNLLFAELVFTEPDQRRFDVSIEGKWVLNDFDIVQEVGPGTAVTKSFHTRVTDQFLDIWFVPQRKNATISAIEVIEVENFPAS
jgi:hypothetical protein